VQCCAAALHCAAHLCWGYNSRSLLSVSLHIASVLLRCRLPPASFPAVLLSGHIGQRTLLLLMPEEVLQGLISMLEVSAGRWPAQHTRVVAGRPFA